MANICIFRFQAKGKREDIRKVLDAVGLKTTDLWIGRGAEVWYDETGSSAGMITVEGTGSCKNSLEGALKCAAQEMEEQRVTGNGIWCNDEISSISRFMTIGEACRAFGVNMEFYSEETECRLAEHVVIEDGNEEWSDGEAYEDYDEATGDIVAVSDYDGCGYGIGYPKAA